MVARLDYAGGAGDAARRGDGIDLAGRGERLGAGGGLSAGMVPGGAAAIGGGVVIATGSKSSSRRRPASP